MLVRIFRVSQGLPCQGLPRCTESPVAATMSQVGKTASGEGEFVRSTSFATRCAAGVALLVAVGVPVAPAQAAPARQAPQRPELQADLDQIVATGGLWATAEV